jgi:hypothetical protein
MARDPLLVLYALRRHAVEQARYALGTCLKAEADVAERIRRLDDAARRDREACETWQHAPQFLEMAAIRQQYMRFERQTVAADLVMVSTLSGEAREVVTAARSAAEAVEQLISERAAATSAAAATREQHGLDDITRGRHPRLAEPAGRATIGTGAAGVEGIGPEPPTGGAQGKPE